ncbi:alpha/beta hydrolase fold domain-containing protein [Streptomyces sp. PSAA01]|uniref:alpha/beta hydrolase fold domain-containing protein n=1 Tax=Streptomyces sp. PSAA01 TaxID=2912762 RepID=UPI001F43D25E|nr:alpha/beta hydrolase fold domain-containing protein [Streptomyces sp. PSAA01]MCG0285295.1 alpha/beta hydrolase [Streptomyces sp. PSAA01]
MAFTLDPELAAVLQALAEQGGPTPPPARDDWRTLRARGTASMRWLASLLPAYPSGFPLVKADSHKVRSADGAEILVRWYEKADSAPGSAVVYAHGGGMIAGSVDLYDSVVAGYVQATGVPFLSVDYRLAPDAATGTGPVEEVFAALTWLGGQAAELGVDPRRIAVMGDSAGGGLAAGTAVLARDRGVPLARQVLLYPMLDDRTLTPDPRLTPYVAWTWDDNWTGWHALLGTAFGTDAVPSEAAPARVATVAGLATAYVEVGELDIFRAEAVTYAQRLAEADVSTELHVHSGAIHEYDRLAPASRLARRAMEDRRRVITAL